MSISTLLAALGMFVAGELLKWRVLVRRWECVYVNPKTVVFPRLCPVCLSPDPDSSVDEKSVERRTGYYVVASKMEWWKAAVPHCSKCSATLLRNQVIGLGVGAACVVVAFLLAPPSEGSLVVLCYILFGYPAYVCGTTIGKGVLLGSANSTRMSVIAKHREYLDQIAALNPSA